MIQINKKTFSNGLRLVHSQDNTTQMVALNLLYKVGSRDEDEQHTGFAHLFEHLMFGGSVNIPDYDGPVQEAGGENNAWTNSDVTNYYVTVPFQNVETAFWLESDRMLSLDFNEKSLEVQRQVVIEEFKQRYLNAPYGDLSHLVNQLSYKKHPYRWPTIGMDVSHIEKATMDDVKNFFYHHYGPDNCILTITGHIEFEEACRLCEKWFGDIPCRNIQHQALPQEDPHLEARRAEVIRDVPVDVLVMSFPMCDIHHPDYYATDMLSDLLCNGRSSRLIEKLVDERHLFSMIDAHISGTIDAGLLIIQGKMAEGVSLEMGEKAVWDELYEMTRTLPDAHELEKVKNRFESDRIFSNMNYLNVASSLAYFECIDKAEDINEEVARYRGVTPEQLMRVAGTMFRHENSNVLYYRKKNV